MPTTPTITNLAAQPDAPAVGNPGTDKGSKNQKNIDSNNQDTLLAHKKSATGELNSHDNLCGPDDDSLLSTESQLMDQSVTSASDLQQCKAVTYLH